jgi:virginiamycin B lyase
MQIHKVFLRVPQCALLSFALAVTLAATADKVTIKEWDVPTPNSRPHDPAVAPDGALWYTGQRANKLGRLDPQTGQFKEYPLKTPGSGPHGLVADSEGNIWFTAIAKGYVGKLNPKTGEVTEYHMPNGEEVDPHTPVIDQQGVLWFTTEQANFVGRLDPKTGQAKLIKVPTPHAVPYGIVVTSSGVPYFCEFGSNKLASIDPKSFGGQRVSAAAACAAAAAGFGSGRDDLLHRLCARVSGTL